MALACAELALLHTMVDTVLDKFPRTAVNPERYRKQSALAAPMPAETAGCDWPYGSTEAGVTGGRASATMAPALEPAASEADCWTRLRRFSRVPV